LEKPFQVTFAGGSEGLWKVQEIRNVRGEGLPVVERVAVYEGEAPREAGIWNLRGIVGHARYTGRGEQDALAKVQAGLGRPEALCAVLIPIRKNRKWWDLAQDERRQIFEEKSRHIAMSLDTLPAVARRLHHSRDLGEPFDFLTWFEFAPEHSALFDDLVEKLRKTEEWDYVEREVEIRLRRA
jgi:hypothetical protein